MLALIAAIGTVLTAMGLGGVLGAYVQHRLQARRAMSDREQELKERRYLCILILMLAKLKPEIGIAKVQRIRPDLPDLGALDEELETETLNAVVFASNDVLGSLAAFVKQPSHGAFAATASAMRRDLWGRRHKLAPELVQAMSDMAAPDLST